MARDQPKRAAARVCDDMRAALDEEDASPVPAHCAVACRVSSCRTQLTSKTRPRYCRRYKVCETHLRALTVNINGAAQRWCQKCSRFHEVDAFTDKQHSCTQSLLRSRTQHMQRTVKRTNVTAITSPPPAAPLTPFPTVPYESVAQQLAVFGWDVPLVPDPNVAMSSLFAFLNDTA